MMDCEHGIVYRVYRRAKRPLRSYVSFGWLCGNPACRLWFERNPQVVESPGLQKGVHEPEGGVA